MSTQQPNTGKKSLMHNLGEFFGHIAHGVTSDPNAPKTQENATLPMPVSPPGLPPERLVRQQTLEQQVETPEGKLILRRTIIDEVRRTDDAPETL